MFGSFDSQVTYATSNFNMSTGRECPGCLFSVTRGAVISIVSLVS